MLKYKWTFTTIRTNRQANDCFRLFAKQKPQIAAFDTETTGLHIILDVPFLFQFGWLNESTKEGFTFVVDIERQPILSKAVIQKWHTVVKSCKKYLAHNIKYDLHMLTNIHLLYESDNVSDTMFYIRYASPALTPANGGPSLALKDYAAAHITPNAKQHEHLLKLEQKALAKTFNDTLKASLAGYKPPEKYKARSYTIGVLDDMFKDCTFEISDLPADIQPVYKKWLRDLPPCVRDKMTGCRVSSEDIPYTMLDRENLITYGHWDIVYVLEIYAATAPVVEALNNTQGVLYEESIIYPLYEMERVGFKTDVEYLEEARKRIRTYIRERRQDLIQQAQQEFSIGQHATVKAILNNYFGLTVDSTSSAKLDLLVNELKRTSPNASVIEFIETLQELRTLEKWYAVYILRFQKSLHKTDRLYTTINQVGTVSGRVTSDFQQFPKEGIVDNKGNELFHPRKIVLSENGIVYLDYSQIELRFQALYTILVGHPDLNLCRAYMPYKCVNKDGHLFDYNNPEDIKNWAGEWYYEEDPTKHWEPTDVHGATTTAATGLKPGDPEYKHARSVIGKRTNFAKNYGAQYKKICEMFPDKSPEECRRIDQAYYKAFPGVKAYHSYCYDIAKEKGWAVNLFGIHYYGISGHKLINLLVQGSAAYYLKWKIKQVYDYRKTNNLTFRFQMNIHDELSFVHNSDPLETYFEIKRIMQDWSETMVPIVADMEATNTTWAGKKDVESIEDLRLYLST